MHRAPGLDSRAGETPRTARCARLVRRAMLRSERLSQCSSSLRDYLPRGGRHRSAATTETLDSRARAKRGRRTFGCFGGRAAGAATQCRQVAQLQGTRGVIRTVPAQGGAVIRVTTETLINCHNFHSELSQLSLAIARAAEPAFAARVPVAREEERGRRGRQRQESAPHRRTDSRAGTSKPPLAEALIAIPWYRAATPPR